MVVYKQDKEGSEKQSRQKDEKKEEVLMRLIQGEWQLCGEKCGKWVGEWNTWIHDFAGDNRIHSVLMGMSGWDVTKEEVVKKPSGHGVVP